MKAGRGRIKSDEGDAPGEARRDVGVTPLPELAWEPDKRAQSLKDVADYVTREARAAIAWYLRKKATKRMGARVLRLIAIAATVLAGLIPLLAEMFVTAQGEPKIAPAWASVALLVAAATVGLDRFFGYSSAWMRFLTTEMQIRHALHEFLIDWETRRAVWEGREDPGPQETEAGLKRCKEFLAKVDGLLQTETGSWVVEFSSAVADIDRAAKAQAATMRQR